MQILEILLKLRKMCFITCNKCNRLDRLLSNNKEKLKIPTSDNLIFQVLIKKEEIVKNQQLGNKSIKKG